MRRVPPRTLKGQLTLFFLLFTLAPTLLLSAVATRQILDALERWETPGVERALDGSLIAARDHLELLKNDLRQRGQVLAADPVLEAPWVEAAVRERLAGAYNLDFVQLYGLDGKLLFATTRDPLVPSPALTGPPDPTQGFLEDPARGLLAYVGYGGEPGKAEWVLVAGIDLGPAFYARREDLARAVATYRDLPRIIRLNQRTILLGLGVLVVGLAVVSAWVARRLAATVSRPVHSLALGMEHLARGEDAIHVTPQGTVEMEQLMGTFNTMSLELSRSRRDLARAERLSAWREMAQRVAHEMKNALTPVTFGTHRLGKMARELPEPERERFLNSLRAVGEEVEGLKRLADSFSELARLPVPEFSPVDLREVIQGVTEGVTEGVGEDGKISWAATRHPVLADADRTLLRQALLNLVKNAREAAGERGHVWVRLEEGPGETRIHVEDDGPGWSERERDLALEPYYTTKTQGTGLGLSVVQRTMIQHGGTIELGDRPGGGARVTLVLPAARTSETVPPRETP